MGKGVAGMTDDAPPTKAELRLIHHLRQIGYGEATVKVESGQPTRIIVTKESIQIPHG